MSLSVTPHAAGAICPIIESGIVAVTEIDVSYTYSFDDGAGTTIDGSGSGTTSRVTYVLDSDTLANDTFAIGRGMSFCGRAAVFQEPTVNQLMDGTMSETVTVVPDPPDVFNGYLHLSVLLLSATNANEVDVSVVVVPELWSLGAQGYLTVTCNKYTLSELIDTHVVTLTPPLGFTGSGSVTYTVS